ncbi:MAG: hypothetical protein OEO20_00485 [Gemmatimonadota bacterium]|nr:hypothetical protein [Gemmatimonadota bacterium]MDH3367318.1 hypothetical protein [Gemmatimonadota bacterium]MDH3476765.1 hypothetical protein [Gemmatimonadota bacterium]MDH3568649.1 hypothetical protein [Gemmatimonadota bacterium]MDH5551157.1 hypothetical protein [Gemmatimonadota bacterium]
MRRITRLTGTVGALALVLAGCGSDVGTNSGDPLTQAEAAEIFAQLQTAVADALGSPSAPATVSPPEVMAVPIPTSSATCPAGGSVSVSGSADETATGISFSLTETVSNCGIVYNTITFTVDGDPHIKISGDITIGGDMQVSGTYDMQGGFLYSADDGRAGSCAVDASVNFTTFNIGGSLCGHSLTN